MSLARIIVGVLAVCALLFANGARAAAPGPEGNWQGKLDVGGGLSLRLIFHVVKSGDTITATLDSVDQGAKGIPVESASIKGGKLVINVPAVQGSFEGVLNADGNEAEGTWTQGTNAIPLTLKRGGTLPDDRKPQEPTRPYPYIEEEVSYPNPLAKGVTLAGTLTMPKTGGPFPVALLITGSGPQDRNETLLGHKPFLVLSDYLTRRGIAVLRVDDRGVAKSTGSFATATTADFATDVEAGIAFLKNHKGIDPKRIGLIGHSEGGVIAPMVAAETPDVAFIVLMAGTGVNGEEIIIEQGALIAKAGGAPADLIQRGKETNRKLFAIIKSESDSVAAEKKLLAEMKLMLASLPEEERKAPNAEAQLTAQVKSINSPWFRYFLMYDPAPTLKRVKCPVLALNGEKDLQVPPTQNLPVIEAALKAGGNRAYTVKLLPGLNHLFQTSNTGAPSEYATISETIAPVALKTIGDWIVMHTSGK